MSEKEIISRLRQEVNRLNIKQMVRILLMCELIKYPELGERNINLVKEEAKIK